MENSDRMEICPSRLAKFLYRLPKKIPRNIERDVLMNAVHGNTDPLNPTPPRSTPTKKVTQVD
jgi:hypothetical protein